MSTLTLKELSAPTGEVIKIAAGKTLDLKSQGSVTMPTGSVLQVVTGTTTTAVTITSSSYTDSGITATITPQSTSSKILVITSCYHNVWNPSGADTRALARIVRGSTEILDRKQGVYLSGSTDNATYSDLSMSILDSPATTSATTYKVQGAKNGAQQISFQSDSRIGQITLMEIQG